ncbi:hypothetical protein [Paraflavitalea pollutisoli]|uniref:hypothetical protein n=1 Tax=Paraflavitalea pollutisoli TaxID=3034143 RepID=UPI0023EBB026|nr:hypothetical protein [Paraflavitalea sp. H1-2-19X]
MENKDINTVLDKLSAVVTQCQMLQQVYLEPARQQEAISKLSPIHSVDKLRHLELPLPDFLRAAGIRSMTVTDIDSIETVLGEVTAIAKTIAQSPGALMKHPELAKPLQQLFRHATTVAFADWALFASASECWDSILTQVIKPIGRRDHEFIFYLGDISGSPFFLVDELLDIMGEFSRYGKVTFILDQQEMLRLWQGLNGVHRTSGDSWPFDYEEKYRALFNAMNIQRLLVYANNGVSYYSKEQKFNLTRRVLSAAIENNGHARNDFINGYSMGLTLGVDIDIVIALGIVYYSARGEYNAAPDQQMLLNYIKTWRNLQDSVA